MKQAMVSLVGAGTGEYGMITLRGLACIQAADCIIYDNLVDSGLLTETKADCEALYVGKIAGQHYSSQDEINRLIAEKAAEGKYVVRLKGGDPFVFGRGAEEALYLRDRKISFEIIPGISSAVAGPAFAGIPVTHRELARSFHVITAHTCNGGLSPKDFDLLARQEGTLIFLMGLSQAEHISAGLIDAGMDKDRPSAAISLAGTNRQLTVTATLKTLGQEIRAHALTAPALIVIGETVKLREALNFFEQRPLFGKKILVTRAEQSGSGLSRLLSERGAQVISIPTIRIVPRPEAAEAQIQALPLSTHLVFTSARTVTFFMDALLASGKDVRALSGKVLCAVGSSTAKALAEYGLKADLVPAIYSGAELGKLLKMHLQPTDLVLLPQSAAADPELRETLLSCCAVTVVPIYDTLPVQQPAELLQRLAEEKFDAAVFTSSSAAKALSGTELPGQLLNDGTVIFSIGPVTSNTLHDFGFSVHESDVSTIDAMADCVTNYFMRDEML